MGAEVDEILLGLGGWAKVNLPAFIEDSRFVEEVVGTLRGLVNRDGAGLAKELGLKAEGLAELDGVTRVETTG